MYIIPSLWRWTKTKYQGKSQGSETKSKYSKFNASNSTNNNRSEAENEGLLSPAESEHTLTDLEAASSSLQREILNNTTKKQPNFTLYETAKLASQFSILWYLANLFSNASLSYTSVGSSTLLTSTSSFFTLLVGSVFKVEKFSFKKLGALAISILGVALINMEESISTSNSVPSKPPSSDSSSGGGNEEMSLQWLGNLMALISAFLYGVYTTLLKLRVGEDEERINMFHFFGFVGLFNLALLWPVIVAFDYLGIEKFELPSTEYVWVIVLVNAASTVVSDFCWAMSMLLTSPLVVTVGLSATIPLALAGDMILKSHFGTWLYYVGALLMCLAFFIINKQETTDQTDNDKASENNGDDNSGSDNDKNGISDNGGDIDDGNNKNIIKRRKDILNQDHHED